MMACGTDLRNGTFSCPNGDCAFPPSKSLSWCSQCVDPVDEVAVEGDDMNIDFGYDPANDTLNEKGVNNYD